MANILLSHSVGNRGRKRPVYALLRNCQNLSFCLTALLVDGRGVESERRPYAVRMKLILGLLVISLSVAACASPSADLGSRFADAFDGFAPLGVLHRSYSDYLFYGTDVAIPGGLDTSCPTTGTLLGLLHIELLMQTGAHVVAGLPRLARLRADLAEFCARQSENLVTLAQLQLIDLDVLKRAGDEGLFAEIYALQDALQIALDAVLEELPDDVRMWEFAVAFSLRTLLNAGETSRLEPSLRSILYGSEEASEPPAFLPEELSQSIIELAALIGVPLDDAARSRARELAETVYHDVMERP